MRNDRWVAMVMCVCAWPWLGCEGAGSSAGSDEEAPLTGAESTHYTEVRYPIVLIPGLLGFRTLLGAIDYFTAIPEALEADGAHVYVATVSQANTPMARAQQVI